MQIYRVGGAVRDRLLQLPVYDNDWVVVGASVEQMLAAGYQPVGKDFPVFLHPKTHEEYALARTERKSGQGYQGFEFFASPQVSLEEDLQRRDLTINAIAEDDAGRLIDPYGGQQDLQARLLRHVSPAFREDPLRVLRVARFAARLHHLGFRVAPQTRALMQQISASDELSTLSAERVWKELERALGEADPQQFLLTLRRCGALQRLLPEWQRLCDGDDDPDPDRASESDSGLDPDAYASPALRGLRAAVALGCDSRERIALLGCYIGPDAVQQLFERLKAPREYRDFGLLCSRHYRSLLDLEQRDAESQLQLFQALDLGRRPQRLAPFIRTVQAYQQAQCGAAEPFGQGERLARIVSALATLQPKALVEAGFTGKALGQELQRRQIERIRTLP